MKEGGYVLQSGQEYYIDYVARSWYSSNGSELKNIGKNIIVIFTTSKNKITQVT